MTATIDELLLRAKVIEPAVEALCVDAAVALRRVQTDGDLPVDSPAAELHRSLRLIGDHVFGATDSLPSASESTSQAGAARGTPR